MTGISSLIGAIVAIIVVTAVGIGVINYHDRMLRNQSAVAVAEQTARQYDEFGQALNAYVNSNFNNNIIGQVSCTTLKQDNFLSSSFSCTDTFGEVLEGDISEPWGFPQTWIVYPSTAPNQSTLAKYGLITEAEWKAWTYLVAQDVQGMDNSMSAFSIENGAFMQPQSSVSDELSDYFPSSGTEFSQTAPAPAYNDDYSFFIAPALQKNPDYWVFNVVITENYNTGNPSTSPAQITYTNLGDSAVCPQDGLVPTNPGNWEFTPWIPGTIMLNGGGGIIPGQYNYSNINLFLCIPSPKNIINTSTNIFSNIGPITSLNYAPDQVEIDNGQTYNGAANSIPSIAPQVGHVYGITVGMAQYTFIAYISLYSSGYYNSGNYQVVWGQYINGGGVLWEGTPVSNTCVMSSPINPAPEVSPEPPAPCWNAINDLGLTNINLG
ncbi:MAG: hypothetical protein M1467_03295 [Deltaproteobacteria bacterium]|nr:hypothetical protein [Deltaproteobacteria bacterium]